jgi:hypothetical protein
MANNSAPFSEKTIGLKTLSLELLQHISKNNDVAKKE